MGNIFEHAKEAAEDVKEYFEDGRKRLLFGIVGLVVAFLGVWWIASAGESDKLTAISYMDRQQAMEDSVAKIANRRADCEVITARERNSMIENAKADIRETPKYKAFQTEINEFSVKSPSKLGVIWEIMLYALAAAGIVGLIFTLTTQINFIKIGKSSDYMTKAVATLAVLVWAVVFIGMVIKSGIF